MCFQCDHFLSGRLRHNYRLYSYALAILIGIMGPRCSAQADTTSKVHDAGDGQVNVNWLYGAYVPRDVPLKPLTGDERLRLYVRQTFTTPGIYIKTALFSVHDQIANSPPEWGDGIGGYGKRIVSRQAQFIIQNSLSAAGNAATGWEPRYDRCRCTGLWPRTRHAIVRNFVTYDRTGKRLRPQLMPYAAAFGAGSIAGSWQPGHPDLVVRGYQSAITQVGVGIGTNWISEFAPEIFRMFRKRSNNKD